MELVENLCKGIVMSKICTVLFLISGSSLVIRAMENSHIPAAVGDVPIFNLIAEIPEIDGEATDSSTASDFDSRLLEDELDSAQHEPDYKLIVACRNGLVAKVKSALKKGANPNTVGLDGKPVLWIAAFHQNGIQRIEMVRELLLCPDIDPNPMINGNNRLTLLAELNRLGQQDVAENIIRALMQRQHGHGLDTLPKVKN